METTEATSQQPPQFLPDTPASVRFAPHYGDGLGDLAYQVRGDASKTTMYFRRQPGENTPAGVWWGTTDRKDTDGREWTCFHNTVIDDFGHLVEVRV